MCDVRWILYTNTDFSAIISREYSSILSRERTRPMRDSKDGVHGERHRRSPKAIKECHSSFYGNLVVRQSERTSYLLIGFFCDKLTRLQSGRIDEKRNDFKFAAPGMSSPETNTQNLTSESTAPSKRPPACLPRRVAHHIMQPHAAPGETM